LGVRGATLKVERLGVGVQGFWFWVSGSGVRGLVRGEQRVQGLRFVIESTVLMWNG